ncbi:hypothetical protein ACFE04_006277 [Oxalis oulophora]
MIKTLNPYSDAVNGKTAEIMSKYRPIAPKPEGSSDESSSMSNKINQSPYLRNVWPQMQARATRTRKRGCGNSISPTSLKKRRTNGGSGSVFGLATPGYLASQAPKTLSLHRGATSDKIQLQLQFQFPSLVVPHSTCGGVENHASGTSSIVTLPLLPSCNHATSSADKGKMIDLNHNLVEIPEEKDLLAQLQNPITTNKANVVKPVAIRPVNSTITVSCIDKVVPNSVSPKTFNEIEEVFGAEVLPAVVSDSCNKVRLANSSYKELVGQPECSWIDGVGFGEKKLLDTCKRINGEVMIDFTGSSEPIIGSSISGFTCWVRIEFGNYNNEGKKKCVNAFCDVVRLWCKDKDYVFTWRFHTQSKETNNNNNNNNNNNYIY